MRRILKLSVFFVAILLNHENLRAQQNQTSVKLFYEKVYLHTDRGTYAPGEDIWFKAYVVNAQNNQPINYSHNLYVELISPRAKVMLRRAIRLENGLGNGDFKLPNPLLAGSYRLRAYTNWMRNFGDNFIFEKKLTLVANPADMETGLVKAATTPPQQKGTTTTEQTDEPAANVARFFPEGGASVNNVLSTIAVKAENAAGIGVPAVGEVFASSGRSVAKFTCDSLGMGSFSLTPDETQEYHAEVKINGVKQSFKIAKALHKGFVLSVSTNAENIAADVSCNGYQLSDFTGSFVIVEARHGDKIYFKQRVPVESTSILVQIPNEKIPEGIACITLYDEHGKPLNQRVVYVHHTNNPTLTLTTDKAIYQPKEQVTVKLKLSDTIRANLSLAVVDAGVVPVADGDILSYLTLRSEIKGAIAHAKRYFDPNNANRFAQLDLLLLTQGWRDFLWKRIADVPFTQKFEVGQGITIKGSVKTVATNKALPGLNITLFLPEAVKDKMFSARTDSAGNFLIDGAILYDYGYGLITSRNDKGKTRGWVRVDSLWQDVMPVKPVAELVEVKEAIATTTKVLLDREVQRKKFSFTKNNQLNEVEIKSKTTKVPDRVFNISKKDYGTDDDFRFLVSYLLVRIPHSMLLNGSEGTQLKRLFFIRGIFLDGTMIKDEIEIKCSYINDTTKVSGFDFTGVIMNDVTKVTISYPTELHGLPKVYLVLRPGAMDKIKEFNTTWADLQGYNKARVFYTPKDDTTYTGPDYRTTIHWQPNITTDRNGEATVTFYNADPKTNIKIIAQGLTETGLPITATAAYHVK